MAYVFHVVPDSHPGRHEGLQGNLVGEDGRAINNADGLERAPRLLFRPVPAGKWLN